LRLETALSGNAGTSLRLFMIDFGARGRQSRGPWLNVVIYSNAGPTMLWSGQAA
jgi:hypothetical protein